MKWVYPQFLFALAVLLIPLLIHLFHFKRYKTLYFSSLTFLKSVEQNQKSARKLKYWLIFTSRALAFMFLVFAFAQPFIPANESNEKAGSQLIGVYLDNSFSMTRIGQNGELISQAQELARSLVDEAPRNAQFILFTNDLGGNEKQTLTKAQFLDKIEQISTSPLVRSANDVARWWQQLINESIKNDKPIASSQLIYLSDFQKSTFGDLSPYSDIETTVYPVVLSPEKTGNLYVDSIWFETPTQKLGTKQTLYAVVRNESKDELSSLDVTFKIGRLNRDVFATVPAYGSDTVSVSFFNNQLGRINGEVTVNDRQMNADDSFFFSYDVKKTSKVLIVDGEDAVSNVAIVYSLDAFYEVKSVSESAFSKDDLAETDLVVINGSNQLSSALSTELVTFSESGGTILLFPGTNCAVSSWNAFLTKIHLPLLSSLQSGNLAIKKLNALDPFFNGVFEKTPSKFSLQAVSKSYKAQGNSSTLSIDLLTFQNGFPFFVRGTGKDASYLCMSSLNKDFSSFTSNQLFSTLLLRIGELSGRQAPLYLTIGDDGSFPIKGRKVAENAVHLTQSDIDFIPSIFTKKGLEYLSVQGLEATRILKSGNYSLTSGAQKLGSLSLNYARKESKVAAYEASEINDLFQKAGLKVAKVSEASGWSGAQFLQLDQKVSYWKWCVIFALLFVLLEMLIVIRFKK